MRVSKRLETLLAMVPSCDTLVDIGTDHGLLMIKAVQTGLCKKAFGLDIAKGPLNQAKINIDNHEMSHKITLQLSDGLKSFNDHGDVFVIAGMGAETIFDIIKSYEFNTHQIIIIQSNTKNAWLRKALTELGYKIIDESFLMDNNQPVFISKIVKGHQVLSLEALYLGPTLSVKPSLEYVEYLKERFKKLKTLHRVNKQFEPEYICLSEFLSKRSD